MKFIPTTPADLEKLKGRAKLLKRKHNLKHRDALEHAAREAGYLHWHHAVQCQKQSEASARSMSLQFMCECIRHDALKGETHYVGDTKPFPFVLLTNGLKDAFLLEIEDAKLLVLAEAGVEREFKIDESGPPPAVTWHGTWDVEGERLQVQEPGRTWSVAINGEAFHVALERATDFPHVHVHDVEDPNAQQLLNIMLHGQGLEPITAEIAEQLVRGGYELKAVEHAMLAGAMYSKARNSVFYPPEVG